MDRPLCQRKEIYKNRQMKKEEVEKWKEAIGAATVHATSMFGYLQDRGAETPSEMMLSVVVMAKALLVYVREKKGEEAYNKAVDSLAALLKLKPGDPEGEAFTVFDLLEDERKTDINLN